MTIRDVITELVRKECESHRLIDLGLLASVEEGVDLLFPKFEADGLSVLRDADRFRIWRKEVLQFFYRKLDYAVFVRNAWLSDVFMRYLFALKKRQIARLRERHKAPTIDRDLAVGGRTFAFKLSGMLAEELFRQKRSALLSAETPDKLEEICDLCCRAIFPIDMAGLLERLKKNDTPFWDDLYLTIEKIAQTVTFRQSVSIQYRKEVLQDIGTDTFFLLRKKIGQEEFPAFETALHFRHYIARICLNKCREAVRKYNLSDIELTLTGEMSLEVEEEETVEVDLPNGGLDGIDFDNEEEVGFCLAAVLFDKWEPWYSVLTRGIEDRIELLFLHYVEGLSYEEIAVGKGVETSTEERRRLVNKLRQDAVRTRHLLKWRFVELLKKM